VVSVRLRFAPWGFFLRVMERFGEEGPACALWMWEGLTYVGETVKGWRAVEGLCAGKGAAMRVDIGEERDWW